MSVASGDDDAGKPPPGQLHVSTVPNEQGLSTLRPPSPLITRRDRRLSLSERASQNPVETGLVKYFCRQRGHGFITPQNGGDDIFLHISDIEGEYVPREGDLVEYQRCPIPPKFEKHQAIFVTIRNLCPGIHERWTEPPHPHPHPHPSPNTPEFRHPEAFHFSNAEAAVRANETKQAGGDN